MLRFAFLVGFERDSAYEGAIFKREIVDHCTFFHVVAFEKTGVRIFLPNLKTLDRLLVLDGDPKNLPLSTNVWHPVSILDRIPGMICIRHLIAAGCCRPRKCPEDRDITSAPKSPIQ
jgi:hypothetical protein